MNNYHITKENLFAMKLHETLHLNDWTSVLRVFGGWIYIFVPPDEGSDFGVFVPEVQNVEVKTGSRK